MPSTDTQHFSLSITLYLALERVAFLFTRIYPFLTFIIGGAGYWRLKTVDENSVNLLDFEARFLTSKPLLCLKAIGGKEFSEQGDNLVKEILGGVGANTKQRCDNARERGCDAGR